MSVAPTRSLYTVSALLILSKIVFQLWGFFFPDSMGLTMYLMLPVRHCYLVSTLTFYLSCFAHVTNFSERRRASQRHLQPI